MEDALINLSMRGKQASKSPGLKTFAAFKPTHVRLVMIALFGLWDLKMP